MIVPLMVLLKKTIPSWVGLGYAFNCSLIVLFGKSVTNGLDAPGVVSVK